MFPRREHVKLLWAWRRTVISLHASQQAHVHMCKRGRHEAKPDEDNQMKPSENQTYNLHHYTQSQQPWHSENSGRSL